MAEGTPELHAVPDRVSSEEPQHYDAGPRGPESGTGRGQGRGSLALIVVLALLFVGSIGFAAWSRSEMGARIAALEDDIFRLHGELRERDRVIEAQAGRLGQVRTSVDELRELLDRPLPEVPGSGR
jgi:uncharacterized small protein (DUF1192 family)